MTPGIEQGKKDKPVEVDCRSGMEEEEGRAGGGQALYVDRVSTLRFEVNSWYFELPGLHRLLIRH